jgi:hypothetical protein
MPGAQQAPAASRGEKQKPHERSHHGYAENTRHSRTRMVLTVSFVISPAIGLSCHRRMQVTTCKLDASVEASGPHDFAVREAGQRTARVHRIPHPTNRDDRDTPLM